MITVKVSTSYPEWPLERQTPASSGVWGNCRFVINKAIEKCDWWVVCDELLSEESTVCPPSHTIFVMVEPPTVKKYQAEFLAQFGLIITSHKRIGHPRVIHTQQALPWHIGRRVRRHANFGFSLDYDELKALQPPKKTKCMSVICSNKSFTEGQRLRQAFVGHLVKHFKDRVDVFGWGVQEIEDKWEALAQYKYHVVLENSIARDYWTEKLADAYLGWSYPFYSGCPNLEQYFPSDAFLSINIVDPGESIEQIERAIAAQTYEQQLEAIRQSRDLVLDRYNLFAVLANLCTPGNHDVQPVHLKPQNSFLTARSPIDNAWGSVKSQLKRIPTVVRVANSLRVSKENLRTVHAVASWYFRGSPVPPPTEYKHMTIAYYARRFGTRTLIETGTYFGETIWFARFLFKTIYSVELCENLHREIKARFSTYPHITLIQGDSGEVLPKILASINEPCLFWLDGHYSGGVTAKGKENTPIRQELESILNHQVANHIVLIDDARCFNGTDGYPTIDELRSVVVSKRSNLLLKVKNDIMRIHG